MLTSKLNHLNFHPLELVSRYRDPQLQVGENYSHLFNLRKTFANLYVGTLILFQITLI